MEYFTLSNGNKMPMAGIGVFMMSPAEVEAAVESAIKSGVRLIDTANGYMNESGTGRGIKKSGVAREEIFLVTKLWPTVYEKETAIDETLARLGTDYIDLLFLHQPTDNWREGYRNIEKAYKEGKVKAIGLSNFPEDLLKEAIETMDIKPHVVQVEAHPYFPQTELKAFLAETGMGLMAWYPLGHGDKNLINEPVFAKLAGKYGKTNAQIILRWHVEDSREECERGNTPSKPGNVPKREEVLLVCSDLGGWDNAHPICVKRYPITASPAVYSSREFSLTWIQA